MQIWLNGKQVERALDFFKPEVWAEVTHGDVYIDTNTDEIVFMGVNYPVSYSLKGSKFVLDCDEEPFRLNAIVKMCDCNFGFTKVFDQFGNMLEKFTIDLWEEDAGSAVERILKGKNVKYDYLSVNTI